MIDDVDRIMDVMDAAFDPAFGEAWSRRQVEDALALGNCHYCLISAEGKFPQAEECAAGFFLSRMGYEEEELLLLGVTPEFRRRGLANTLLIQLRDGALARGARRLLLEMRKGNPAEALYRDFGFYIIGQRPDYYRTADGQRIDALTFACDIPLLTEHR